ncbi:MAG: alpha/beta hydrolase [Microvirga sp.]
MTLDPVLAAKVEKGARFPPMNRLPLDLVRDAALRQLATGLPKEPVGSIEDIRFEGPDRPIRVRVYRPDSRGDRPLTLFFHGSGFVICSLDTHDDMCRQICRRAGSVVVSVDYSLAPERPFPAGPEDCFAATLWAVHNAGRLGADPARLAVCGDSAGGNLAAGVALRARAEGGPAIKAQILIYPVTDHYSAGHRSYVERGSGCGLLQEDMRWFWDSYLPDPSLAQHPAVSPARAENLDGLPPAYIAVAEYDVLRDEGLTFARRLAEAGIPVELRHYPDMNHGFLNWVGIVDRAGEAMDDLTAWMRATL